VARGTAHEGRRAWPGTPPSTHARAELPIDPAACPALEPAFHEALDEALGSAGIVLDAAARAGIEAQARLLVVWTAAINLTAIRTSRGVALEHVADALAALPLLRGLGLPEGPAILDLGSGGGYPGLPLGLALPAGRLALVDSIGKKARFLRVAAAAAEAAAIANGGRAPRVDVFAVRAEALGAAAEHRGRWDLVTARAVGELRVLVELALPLLRRGGWLVAWKRDAGDGALAAEIAAAETSLARLGGVITAPQRVGVAGLEDHRLIGIRRAAAAPGRTPPHGGGRPRRASGAAC
jgi:16S rRNA (guanine527-N7)-methyltransferase